MGDVSSMRSEAKKTSAAGFTSFNRFSTFVKSGGENFVLGKLNANVQESDVIQVVVSNFKFSDEYMGTPNQGFWLRKCRRRGRNPK